MDLGPFLGRLEAVERVPRDRFAGSGELHVDVCEGGDVILTLLRHQRSHLRLLGAAQERDERGHLTTEGLVRDLLRHHVEEFGALLGGLDIGADFATTELLPDLGGDVFVDEVLEVGEDVESVDLFLHEEFSRDDETAAVPAFSGGDELVGAGLEGLDEPVDVTLGRLAGKVMPEEPVRSVGLVDRIVGNDFLGDDEAGFTLSVVLGEQQVANVDHGRVLEVFVDFADHGGEEFGHRAGDVEDHAEDFALHFHGLAEHHFGLRCRGHAQAHRGVELHSRLHGHVGHGDIDAGDGEGRGGADRDDVGDGGVHRRRRLEGRFVHLHVLDDLLLLLGR